MQDDIQAVIHSKTTPYKSPSKLAIFLNEHNK